MRQPDLSCARRKEMGIDEPAPTDDPDLRQRLRHRRPRVDPLLRQRRLGVEVQWPAGR